MVGEKYSLSNVTTFEITGEHEGGTYWILSIYQEESPDQAVNDVLMTKQSFAESIQMGSLAKIE